MDQRLLLVDDNPGMIQLMARILAGVGELRFATNGSAALRLVREWRPDLVLLDAEMPGMDGYAVCAAIKSEPELADTSIIFVTGHNGPEFEVKGLEFGASDFIAKPITEPLLLARVRTQLRVKTLTDELKRFATVDALTELANRRGLDGALTREWGRGLRDTHPISLLMVDVDHFKRFNDHYGHQAGDTCLCDIAGALKACARRPADLAARYGGEEFAVLLPQTPAEGAAHVAQRLLASMERLALPHAASPVAPHVTVSIGLASYDPAAAGGSYRRAAVVPTPIALIRSADQSLYAAKMAGRAQAWGVDVEFEEDDGGETSKPTLVASRP